MRAAAPVVEVAGHDQRRVAGHLVAHHVGTAARAAARRCDSRRPRCTQIACTSSGWPGSRSTQCSRPRVSRPGDRHVVVLVVRRSGTCDSTRVAVVALGIDRVAAVGELRPDADRPGIRSAAPPASRPPWLNCRRGVPCTSCRNTTSAPTARTASRSSRRMKRRFSKVKPLWVLTVSTRRVIGGARWFTEKGSRGFLVWRLPAFVGPPNRRGCRKRPPRRAGSRRLHSSRPLLAWRSDSSLDAYRRPFGSWRDAVRACSSGRTASRMSWKSPSVVSNFRGFRRFASLPEQTRVLPRSGTYRTSNRTSYGPCRSPAPRRADP